MLNNYVDATNGISVCVEKIGTLIKTDDGWYKKFGPGDFRKVEANE